MLKRLHTHINNALFVLLLTFLVVEAFTLNCYAANVTSCFTWPVPGKTHMSREYYVGPDPYNNNQYYSHEGLDIPGEGAQIVAARSGTVAAIYGGCSDYKSQNGHAYCSPVAYCSGMNPGYGIKSPEGYCNYGRGNAVVIDHGEGVYTIYQHMASVSVSLNQYVSAGQLLGYIGATGWSEGPHLHFEIRQNASMQSNYNVGGSAVNSNPYGSQYTVDGGWVGARNVSYDGQDPNPLPIANLGPDICYAHISRVTNSGDINLEAKFDAQKYGNGYVISIADENKDIASQTWMFFHQSDNTYIIEDMSTGFILYHNGDNLLYDQWTSTTDLVKWYVLDYKDHYEIAPKDSAGRRWAIGRGSLSSASIVMPLSRVGDDAEKYHITLLDIDPPRRMLEHSGNTYYAEPIGLSMTDSSPLDINEQRPIHASLINYDHEATTHNEVIWTSSDPDIISVDSNGMIMGKKNGTAIITAVSVFNPFYAGEITITVEAALPQEDGWIYADKLPSHISDEDYEIEYINTYVIEDSVSPGEDWTQGEFVKTEYVNDGTEYSSYIQKSTSATCELVDYYFYHICDANIDSTGYCAGNYDYTNSFVHYDSVPKNGLSPEQIGTEPNGVKYYLLKDSNGNDYYCKSGVNCSDASGHGNKKCRVWYYCWIYQNKKPVNIYRYTKTGAWESEPDSNAQNTSIRYRIKPSISITQAGNSYTAKLNNVDTSKIVAYGFILGDNETVTLDTEGRTDIGFTELSNNNTFCLEAAESEKYVRAYMILTENEEERILYSDVF